ncbi:hypothetical protein MFIFM68171_00479 [Madurella fahalii]|uniref:Uncharacterized protein n=1 Tax=Madurella fahalii TaxID=1157608 RepID=A0ABQ0FXQ7_9PEZI
MSDEISSSNEGSASSPLPEAWLEPIRQNAHTSLSSTGDFASTSPRQRVRKRVDGVFVQFLIDYAANNPECPPLFKAYLEDVVLKPIAGDEERRLWVEYQLRTPELKEYHLDTTFTSELEKYTVYDDVYERRSTEAVVPCATIPERYRSKTGTRPSLDGDLEDVIEPLKKMGAGDDENKEGEGGGNEMMSRMLDRLHSLEADHTPEGDSSSNIDARGLEKLLRQLRSIPFVSAPDALPNGGRARDRTGPDWNVASWYKGTRQPPLAARLENVIIFLADEDVNHCINWRTKFAEVVSYLEWLTHDDEDHQLEVAGPETRAMFNDAVAKAKAHALFEKHRYNPTPLEVTKPPREPLSSTRLNWMTETHNWPLPSRNPAPNRTTLLPRATPPRPLSPVNRTIANNPDNFRTYWIFVEEEKNWWQPVADVSEDTIPSGAVGDEQDNLAYIESHAFETFSGENIGWIRRDPTTGITLLPDDTLVVPGDAKGWARERGARRAGLQQMLRAYHPTSAYASLSHFGCGIVLPIDAAKLRGICQSADGPQWTPVSMERSQLPETSGDPMASTIYLHSSFSNISKDRERARLLWEAHREPNQGFVKTLPKNLAYGGPFVWRGLNSEEQVTQDLQRQCYATLRTLKEAYRRMPRPVLEAAFKLADKATKAVYDKGQAPDGLKFAPEEWAPYGSGTFPRYIDAEEMQWLRFLAGECINSKTWNGRFVPDTPKDKYKLFLIFARRVQKLLSDRNPKGLFSRHDAKVTVEELLKVINAGKDNSAVIKCEFQPYDACSWLDRMDKSGHIRFRLDPACYGVIQRPLTEYFPEHRVIWPTGKDFRTRPNYLSCVADWSAVVSLGTPDISRGSNIWNFFASLGFRLGYTIHKIEQTSAKRTKPFAPLSNVYLKAAIRNWEDTYLPQAKQYPTDTALTKIRTTIINELSENNVMLAPVREHVYLDRNDEARTALVWDHNWDWASPAARGQAQDRERGLHRRRQRRQFWSVNRWPLGWGHLSAQTESSVRNDDNLDPAMTYDPFTLDPTDKRYMRPKLKPYREEKVIFRPGPAIYPVGDTKLQREAVEERITDMVHRAARIDRHYRQRTWSDTLATLNPFGRSASRSGDHEDEDSKLPSANLKATLKSWDPQAEWERLQAVRRKRKAEDMDMEGSPQEYWEEEVQSVDVAMTGMKD